ncbi:glycosyl hydrolase [Pseudomonas sp. CG7]|uniref:YCF48-related protein n=1 Tax=Pseudomonas sp. CG7 TaxID=191007 RepID=UPI0020332935|nr:YCF48-related protein [Pseudomonas sp. CG7]MCM2459403.1 glycosyl hydrolase [Pseudomonas sp. CG7]
MSRSCFLRYVAVWAAVLGCGCVSAASQSFTDPLDQVAASTSKAAMAPLMAVARLPNGRLVAAGRRGIIVYTDESQAWQQAQVPAAVDLVALSFIDDDQGWAVGHGGIVLNTADGGRSWRKQIDGRQIVDLLIDHYQALAQSGDEKAQASLLDAQGLKESGPGWPLLDVWFADARQGYVVGAYNLALRTDDGGQHWTVISDQLDNPLGMHLTSIHAVDGELFITGEQGLLLRRQGDRFVAVSTPYTGTFFGLLARPGLLLAYGLRGNAFISHDSGDSWQTVQTGTQSTLTAGAVLNDRSLVLASLSGEVLLSRDDGMNFKPIRTDQPMPFYGVSRDTDQGLVLVGARGVQRQALNVEISRERLDAAAI